MSYVTDSRFKIYNSKIRTTYIQDIVEQYEAHLSKPLAVRHFGKFTCFNHNQLC